MKYKFEIEIPLHEKAAMDQGLGEQVTEERLKRECVESLSQAIKPLVSFDRMETALVDDVHYKYQFPKFRAEGSIYAYNSDHLEHVIKMLQIIRASINPVQAGQISEVIEELTSK